MRKSIFMGGCILLAIGLGAYLVQSCRNPSPSAEDKKGGAPAEKGFVFREKLSDYGFFEGPLKDLKPAKGVVRYELATPLFTDYAVKDRFIVVPAGKTVRYTTEGALDFPDSSMIIKNFAYRNRENKKVLIETRILAKDPEDKAWKVMDYLWDSTQSDAVKHITGAAIPIQLRDDQGNLLSTTYEVPNTNDCKRCHYNNGALSPIGPKARNLNLTLPGHSQDQLSEWAEGGKLSGLPIITLVEKMPDWKDSVHYSIDQRARAYLDVNCSHCHTQGGDAMNTGLFLEFQQKDPQHLGIMKSPVSAGGGAGGLNYDIVPGNSAQSILAYRMNSTEPGTAMPELARTVTHREAVRLISQWIDEMSSSGGNKKMQPKTKQNNTHRE